MGARRDPLREGGPRGDRFSPGPRACHIGHRCGRHGRAEPHPRSCRSGRLATWRRNSRARRGDPAYALQSSRDPPLSAFVDTKVLVRHLTGDPADLARQAEGRLLAHLGAGRVERVGRARGGAGRGARPQGAGRWRPRPRRRRPGRGARPPRPDRRVPALRPPHGDRARHTDAPAVGREDPVAADRDSQLRQWGLSCCATSGGFRGPPPGEPSLRATSSRSRSAWARRRTG